MRFVFALSLLVLCTAAGAADARGTCDLKTIQSITPSDAVIDSVKPIAGPIAHCEVVGHTITQNPGPNRVEWTVMLPDANFGGRYYFVGEGAAAGFVPTTSATGPLAAYYAGPTWKLLAAGFAVAGSDTGHKGMMWDFGVNNPAARLDHGHRGAHVAAVATQAITKAYYAMSSKLYRYHLGCSGGGRMGAMAVYHHPEDYDGAVVSTGFGGGGPTYFPWIVQHVVKNPDAWVSPAKLAFLEKKVHEKCAGPDGLIRDTNACGFDLSSIQCKGESNDTCLTAAEIGTIKVVTGRYPIGPGKSAGGFLLSNPTAWSSFLIGNTRPTNTDPNNPWAVKGSNAPTGSAGMLTGAPGAPSSYPIGQSMYRGFYFDNAKFDMIRDLDFNDPADLKVLWDNHPQLGAVDTDISAYKKAGGKLILWAGIAENAVPPNQEIEYFDALKTAVPGRDDFVRLYLAPGVFHCGGGPGPQDTPDRLLDKVIAWAEQGKRPDAIVANGPVPAALPTSTNTAAGQPVATRTVLLCPYPQMAVFSGKKGDFPYDAANWTCKKP